MTARKPGPLETALLADLQRWRDAIPESLSAAALDAARRLDRPDGSLTGASLLHGQYRQYLSELRKLAPAGETADDVNDLQKQREKRRREAGMA